MNRQVLEGNWKQIKGRLKAEYGRLTDDDLRQIGGDWEVLVGRLMELYGFTRERAEEELERFMIEDEK